MCFAVISIPLTHLPESLNGSTAHNSYSKSLLFYSGLR